MSSFGTSKGFQSDRWLLVKVSQSLLLCFWLYHQLTEAQCKNDQITSVILSVYVALQYLIYLMFFQIHSLWWDTRNPGNGWWIISVVRRERKSSQIDSSHLSSSQVIILAFSKRCIPLQLVHLLATSFALYPAAPHPCPTPLRCAQPSLVLQWFLGGEEIVIMVFHVIHLHVPGPFCPQELLSFREQHAKESEQTVVRLVTQHKRKRERKQGC